MCMCINDLHWFNTFCDARIFMRWTFSIYLYAASGLCRGICFNIFFVQQFQHGLIYLVSSSLLYFLLLFFCYPIIKSNEIMSIIISLRIVFIVNSLCSLSYFLKTFDRFFFVSSPIIINLNFKYHLKIFRAGWVYSKLK